MRLFSSVLKTMAAIVYQPSGAAVGPVELLPFPDEYPAIPASAFCLRRFLDLLQLL